MTLRAGLVGAGQISRFHVQALRRLQGVTIVGVCDTNAERGRALARELSLPFFPTVGDLCDAGANVIHVLTPPASHVSVALEALARGADVFVEKPLATSVEDCDRIAAAAHAAGRQVCVGHSLLYDPFVQRALNLVRDGAIGDVLTFDYFRCQKPSPLPVTGATPEQHRGGFPFRDLGIHALYMAEAFVGRVEDAQAWPMVSGRGDINVLVDEWRVVAKCARGTAQIQMSWNVRPQQNLIVVQGTRGTIRCDLFGLSVTVRTQRPLPEHAGRVVNAVSEGIGLASQATTNLVRFATGRLWQFHGLQSLVGDFYERLAAGRPSPVVPADVRNVIAWTESIARRGDAAREQFVTALQSNVCRPATLVTGATGFIGRALVRRLLGRGETVRVLVRRAPAAWMREDPRVEIVLGDLGDAGVVDRAVAGMKTVYHIGAAMGGSGDDFDRATVNGTRHVVDACLRHRVQRLVYMSSLSVIDTDAGQDGRAIDERSSLEEQAGMRGHYTRTKLESELIVRAAVTDRGLDAVLLRPGEVVSSEKPLLTPGVAQRIGRLLIVIGDGGLKLPLVHVEDVVDALLAAAVVQQARGEVIQLVEDCGLTQVDIIRHYQSRGERYRVIKVPVAVFTALATVVQAVFTAMKRNPPLGPRRIRAATARRTFDCRKAERLLGWQARTGVKAAFGPAADRAVGGLTPVDRIEEVAVG